MPDRQFVFAYGSLVADRRGVVATLAGARRRWGVAMDNSVHVPGYKRYLTADGARPDVCVAFLDLREDASAAVNGVCLPVGPGELAALDVRERNYDRVDVSAQVTGVGGTVWTYRGSADGRSRCEEAARSGRLVVSHAYRDRVRAAFAALGAEALSVYDASTDPPPCPALELIREEL